MYVFVNEADFAFSIVPFSTFTVTSAGAAVRVYVVSPSVIVDAGAVSFMMYSVPDTSLSGIIYVYSPSAVLCHWPAAVPGFTVVLFNGSIFIVSEESAAFSHVN